MNCPPSEAPALDAEDLEISNRSIYACHTDSYSLEAVEVRLSFLVLRMERAYNLALCKVRDEKEYGTM